MMELQAYLIPTMAMLASSLAAGFLAGLFGIGGDFVVVPALAMVLPLFSGEASTKAWV